MIAGAVDSPSPLFLILYSTRICALVGSVIKLTSKRILSASTCKICCSEADSSISRCAVHRSVNSMSIASVEEGIEEIRRGRMVILVDEDAPESDGFFCLAAEKVNAQNVNYMLHHGRGIIYVTLTDERIRELSIPMVPEENSRL